MTGNQRTEIKMENIEITEEILPSSILKDTFTVGDTSTVEDTCTVHIKKEDVKGEISFIVFV